MTWDGMGLREQAANERGSLAIAYNPSTIMDSCSIGPYR